MIVTITLPTSRIEFDVAKISGSWRDLSHTAGHHRPPDEQVAEGEAAPASKKEENGWRGKLEEEKAAT